jgi:hypothetical protein
MGKLDISQYIDSSHGNLIEPPVAHQTIEIDSEARLSAPLHKLARCIRIVSDVDCLIGHRHRRVETYAIPARRRTRDPRRAAGRRLSDFSSCRGRARIVGQVVRRGPGAFMTFPTRLS